MKKIVFILFLAGLNASAMDAPTLIDYIDGKSLLKLNMTLEQKQHYLDLLLKAHIDGTKPVLNEHLTNADFRFGTIPGYVIGHKIKIIHYITKYRNRYIVQNNN